MLRYKCRVYKGATYSYLCCVKNCCAYKNREISLATTFILNLIKHVAPKGYDMTSLINYVVPYFLFHQP